MPHQAQPSGSGARQWDQPQPVGSQAGDVPSKRDLTSWWRQFKRGNPKKDEDKGGFLHLWRRMRTTFVRLRIRAAAAVSRQIGRLARAVFRPLQIAFSAVTLCRELISFYYAEPEKPRGIFGVPLQDSIKYANVAISLFNEEGESYIYGYVPIVVAKCGVFLKEKGFRSFSSMFQSSPHSDTEAKEKRRPNKLQKKRAPSTNPSAASSTNSLHGSHVGGPPSPLPGGVAAGTPVKDQGPHIAPIAENSPPKATASANPLEPSMSPSASMRSHSTVSGGYSEAEHGDDASRAEGAEKERKHGWRLSHRKEGSKPVNENNFGSVSGAEQSMSSVSSKGGRKSLSLDPIEASSSNPAWNENREGDKKNPFDWFRGKIAERKEREEAKQRAKSPPSSIADPSSPSSERSGHRSTSSLAALTHHRRGRSVEQLPRPMQSSPPITLLEAKEEAKLAGLTPPKIESEEVTPTQTPGSASTVPSTAPLATVNAATPEVLPVEGGGPVPAITMQGAPVPHIFAPAPTSPPPAVPAQAAPAQAAPAPANAAPVDAAPAQTAPAPAQTAPEEGSTVSRPQSPRQQQTVRSMLDV
ncbi:hypothetical protein BK809_0004505 [Diplodia seriata]|uniref:Uncharacterized protein n=1 Tax=Diplodia seriata TaxID=420778 RepID=A0A1S8B6T1_9PEZI|nr:hypothetical protein BK809_0004505 [Diplodia seriata]